MKIAVAIYLACFVFNFWATWGSDSKKGYVTRSDLFFILFIAFAGPLGIGAAFYALTIGRFERWASKDIWRKKFYPPKTTP